MDNILREGGMASDQCMEKERKREEEGNKRRTWRRAL
jgi:hypothetical protein